MKWLLIILLCLWATASQAQFFTPPIIFGKASGGAACTTNGYSHCRQITFQSAQVSGGPLSNFTALFLCTSNSDTNCNSVDLRGTGSGGFIQNTATFNGQTVPTDLIFTSDSGCTTTLNWEVASYTGGTGAIEVWILLPSLSGSSNTSIYMCYGNSGTTTYQGGAVGAAWDANYKLVAHYPNGTSLSALDSTSHGNNGTNGGGANAATATAGKIGGGAAFSGTAYIDHPQSAISGATSATYSMWIKTTNTGRQFALGSGVGVCAENNFDSIETYPAGGYYALARGSTAAPNDAAHTTVDGNWHLLTAIYTPTTISIQVDNNSPVTSSGLSNSAIGSGATLEVGNLCTNFASGTYGWQGSIDEVELSNTARSSGWITTEYNNQSSLSTFITVGSQI